MNDFNQLKKHTILPVDDSGITGTKSKGFCLEDTYQVVLANPVQWRSNKSSPYTLDPIL